MGPWPWSAVQPECEPEGSRKYQTSINGLTLKENTDLFLTILLHSIASPHPKPFQTQKHTLMIFLLRDKLTRGSVKNKHGPAICIYILSAD